MTGRDPSYNIRLAACASGRSTYQFSHNAKSDRETFWALPASSAASCEADANRSRPMFSISATSRGVTRIALGSSGRSNNFLRSRTTVSMHSIITCLCSFPRAADCMDALVAAGALLSRVSIAGGDGHKEWPPLTGSASRRFSLTMQSTDTPTASHPCAPAFLSSFSLGDRASHPALNPALPNPYRFANPSPGNVRSSLANPSPAGALPNLHIYRLAKHAYGFLTGFSFSFSSLTGRYGQQASKRRRPALGEAQEPAPDRPLNPASEHPADFANLAPAVVPILAPSRFANPSPITSAAGRRLFCIFDARHGKVYSPFIQL
jgi:hypothetical protein